MFGRVAQVWAVLTSGAAAAPQGHHANAVATARFHVLPAVFEPTYAWATVARGQAVPQGLEVARRSSDGLEVG